MNRLLALLALPLAALLSAPALGSPAKDKDKDLTWRDWNSGVKEANSSHRPMIVDVYTDWCGWCKRMDRDVYARQDVRDYLEQRFVPVRLNAESSAAASYEGKSYTGRTLANRFRVSGYPTTIFLRSGGTHIANVPGYVPADRFLLLLRYIGDGHLDRGVTFDDFVKQSSEKH